LIGHRPLLPLNVCLRQIFDYRRDAVARELGHANP